MSPWFDFRFYKINTMRLAKFIFIILAAFLSSLPLTSPGETAEPGNAIPLYLFWGNGCPHCEKEKDFLKALEQKYPTLKVQQFEVWYDRENKKLFEQIIRSAGQKSAGVPATVIGRKLFIGFSKDTAAAIESAIAECLVKACPDPVEALTGQPTEPAVRDREKMNVPLLGEIDPAKVSLPLFTVIIGALDSFNPCAFFVLFFLLSMLIHARSRKKMLLIGGIFVFFSGFIYFLFMAAWLNVFLVLGRLTAITAAAGVVALLVASINIKDFFFFKKGVSLSIPEKAKPRLFERMRNLLKSSSLPAMLGGTIVLAVTANAYELLCTAGFPMVYTRALTLHGLTTSQYYLYLALYNLVYVVPLAVIVIIMSVTLGARKLSEWQGRQLKLVSGLMMFFLGLVLLVQPALLNNALASIVLLVGVLGLSAVIIYAAKRLKPEIATD